MDFPSAKNSAAYEMMADAFCAKPSTGAFFECLRSKGDLVRYDPATNELAVISVDRAIRTYYTPRFCSAAPLFLRLAKKCHNEATHMDYVRKLCAQH